MLVPRCWCGVGAQKGAALAREAAGPSQAPLDGTEVELGGGVREESGPGPGLSGEGSGCDVTKAKQLGRDLGGAVGAALLPLWVDSLCSGAPEGPVAVRQRCWEWGWCGPGFKEEVADSRCSSEFKIRMFPARNNCSW